MNILLDIVHPADVHVFRNPVVRLRDMGHQVVIASRDKDCTLALLDEYGLDHTCISRQNSGTPFGMLRELVKRNRALVRLAKENKISVVSGVGGVAAAQSASWLGIRSVIFYDTETAKLQNSLTYPFATQIVVPRCYSGSLPEHKAQRYPGYHELSYLHPGYFKPDREIALRNGVSEDQENFLIRLVSWKASHDFGLTGWDIDTLKSVVHHLRRRGRVIISSERRLPPQFQQFEYRGQRAAIHHVIAHCRLTVGESATVTSESVVLGIPSIYAARTPLGYVSEQERRYEMARHVEKPSATVIISAIDELLAVDLGKIRERKNRMLAECTDVSEMIADTILGDQIDGTNVR